MKSGRPGRGRSKPATLIPWGKSREPTQSGLAGTQEILTVVGIRVAKLSMLAMALPPNRHSREILEGAVRKNLTSRNTMPSFQLRTHPLGCRDMQFAGSHF